MKTNDTFLIDYLNNIQYVSKKSVYFYCRNPFVFSVCKEQILNKAKNNKSIKYIFENKNLIKWIKKIEKLLNLPVSSKFHVGKINGFFVLSLNPSSFWKRNLFNLDLFHALLQVCTYCTAIAYNLSPPKSLDELIEFVDYVYYNYTNEKFAKILKKFPKPLSKKLNRKFENLLENNLGGVSGVFSFLARDDVKI